MRCLFLLVCVLLGPAHAALTQEFPLSLVDDHALVPEPRMPNPAPAVRVKPKADGTYEIDLLVLYTDEFANARVVTGGVNTEVQRLVMAANTFYANSKVPVSYRIVGVERYAGPQDLQNYPNTLDMLREDAGMRALRDATGADLVTLLLTTDATNYLGGRAKLFNGGEQSDPPGNVNPERDAFSVMAMGPNASGARGSDWLFAHELGHKMGGGHDFAAHAPASPYWKTYAHAMSCPVRSIMHSGQDAVGVGGVSDVMGDFFTNPALVLENSRCGLAGVDGVPGSGANNARSISEAAPYVAAYRNAKSAPTANTAKSAETGGLLLGGLGLPALFTLLLLQLIRRHPVF